MGVVSDRIKDQVVAKIAMQAADLYADALTNMQVGSIKTMWDKVRREGCVCWVCGMELTVVGKVWNQAVLVRRTGIGFSCGTRNKLLDWRW